MAVEQKSAVQLATRPTIAAGAGVTGGFGYAWLRACFWCAALALGAADAWATRFSMNPDGVSYLDMGDAWWRGDWHMAVSAWWSPLYSWVLGFAMKMLKPSAYWEYPVVHVVNFFIYVMALVCFDFFLRAFIRQRRQVEKDSGEAKAATLPEWAWWALGYTLFIWTSLVLITVSVVSPDMCLAAFFYLAWGLILRAETASWRTFALFGLVLGFGYLTKAVMFPLAFVFIGVGMLSLRNLRQTIPRALLSGLTFLLIAAPFAVALSRAKGRMTFGDVGKVDYAVFVDGVDAFIPEGAALRHPVARILEQPGTYEFSGPIKGTYPIWYDPSYWHEGVKPHFNLRGQATMLLFTARQYGTLLFSPYMQLNVAVVLLILLLVEPRPPSGAKRAGAHWPLVAPALSAMGLYALVFTDYRFIGAFVCLLWLVGFSAVRLTAERGNRKLIATLVIATSLTTGVLLVRFTVLDMTRTKTAGPVFWEAAQALTKRGVEPGDKIAVMGNQPWGDVFVARLARTQVIAEVSQPDGFWTANAPVQAQVIRALADTGAKAVLTLRGQMPSASSGRWKRLGDTPYYICLINGGTH
jgi:hypothetical protein